MNRNKTLLSIILAIALLCFLFIQWKAVDEGVDAHFNSSTEKQKGAHVFGHLDSSNFHFLNQNNVEWVTMVAWSVQDDFDSPKVAHHNGDSSHIQNSNSDWLQRMEFIHSKGFKIFVKPHIWIHSPSSGKWRSDIFPESEENWALWKESYRDFILRYASLAEQVNAEMFCIGTELSRISLEKPLFWKELIRDVRSIYAGEITYAANWYQDYEEIVFWDDLDYIGIQAYFPLTKNENPSVKQISKGWKKYLPSIESTSKKYNLPVIFTELGYKSTTDSAIDPWAWIDYPANLDKTISAETQANCYEAFFNTVWPKDWFAGVHIWQLRSDYVEESSPMDSLDFTPQGKPAERIIMEGFE